MKLNSDAVLAVPSCLVVLLVKTNERVRRSLESYSTVAVKTQ